MSDLYVKMDDFDKDIYHLYFGLSSTGHYWHICSVFIDQFCDAFDVTVKELDKITTELSPAPFMIVVK